MHFFLEQSITKPSLLLLFLEDLERSVFLAACGVSVFACRVAVFLQWAFLRRDLRDAAPALQRRQPGKRRGRRRVRLGRVRA